MTASFDDTPDDRSRRGLRGIGRYLVSPLRRLVQNGEDAQTLRVLAMSDAELADALTTEVYAAQNADDEIWVEGAAVLQEAARRLRERGRVDAA
ncbi:hypothetical protein [Methylopila sp. Yamaguchi]|uniref:hypothetical protein n=1 Tax=Methylopila sp. Yamaguchi TaxID=1437817 RepID=UPI000CB143C6|nr:hypothetical protein [Methylopila sp. Yamaguchi]GBD50896.1 hypothetical protein METY_4109 [Methylopila sp. Yamaguchi]